MHPVLLKIGPITLHTYGFMIAVGFLAAMFLAVREAKLQGIDHEKIMDLCFYMIIVGVVTSRIPYVIFNWHEFAPNPIEIIKMWGGGLVFYGGFLGALAVYLFYSRKHGLNPWKTADLLAPSAALGHFFGRLGCFCAGCCYGKECSLPWAVTFPDKGGMAPIGIPLHPTQLYSAFGLLTIFLLLFFVVRPKKKFHGQVFWTYILVYAIFRFCIEFFRGDDRGEFVFGIFSPSQSLGMIMAGLAIFFFFYLRKKTLAVKKVKRL